MGGSPCVQFRFGARRCLGILTWHVGSFGELRYHRLHQSPSKAQTRRSTRSLICRALQRRPASSYGSATRTVCARTTVPQGTLRERALKLTVCRKSRSVRTATSSLGGSLFKPYFFLARSVENGRQGWLSSSFPAMCAGCKPTRRPGVASGGPLFIRRVTAEELDPIREAE